MMFFSKKNDLKSGRFVVVIGTSPLAMFLTYLLQGKDVEVVVLSSLKKKDLLNNYTFKSVFQNENFSVNFCRSLDKKPECCFVASSFDEYKSDLFFLSDVFLKGVPVINFASFYNRKLIEQMENVEEIRAYFKGWLVKTRKELYLLNRVSDIIICSKNEKGKKIKELLEDKKNNVKEEKNTNKLFCQNICPYFLGNLIILAYDTDVSQILSDSEKRKKIDLVILEVVKLLENGKNQIDEQKVLSDIYAFPDGYSSEFDSSHGVDVLSRFIDGVDYFETPNLFELIAKAHKKY